MTRGAAGLVPADIAGYVARGSDGNPIDRYSVVWAEGASQDGVRPVVGETAQKLNEATDQFRDEDLVPRTEQVFVGADGLTRYCGIWGKPAIEGVTGSVVRDLFEPDFTTLRARRGDQVVVDVAVADDRI